LVEHVKTTTKKSNKNKILGDKISFVGEKFDGFFLLLNIFCFCFYQFVELSCRHNLIYNMSILASENSHFLAKSEKILVMFCENFFNFDKNILFVFILFYSYRYFLRDLLTRQNSMFTNFKHFLKLIS
jgi:hypothetical protein